GPVIFGHNGAEKQGSRQSMSIVKLVGGSLAVVLVAAACSDDESGAQGGGGRGGSSGSSAGTGSDAGDAGPPTLSGTTVEAVRGELTREPMLAGVEACVVDATGAKKATIPCSTTNASGVWSLPNLAANQ